MRSSEPWIFRRPHVDIPSATGRFIDARDYDELRKFTEDRQAELVMHLEQMRAYAREYAALAKSLNGRSDYIKNIERHIQAASIALESSPPIAQNKPSPERVREIAAKTLARISGSPGVFSSTDKIDIIAEAINQALSEVEAAPGEK